MVNLLNVVNSPSIKRNVSKVSFKRRWDIQFLADNWYTFIRNNLRIKINVICIIAQKLIEIDMGMKKQKNKLNIYLSTKKKCRREEFFWK